MKGTFYLFNIYQKSVKRHLNALFGYILYVIISAREPSAQHHCHFGVFPPIFVAQNRGSFLQPRQEIPKWINLINNLTNQLRNRCLIFLIDEKILHLKS